MDKTTSYARVFLSASVYSVADVTVPWSWDTWFSARLVDGSITRADVLPPSIQATTQRRNGSGSIRVSWGRSLPACPGVTLPYGMQRWLTVTDTSTGSSRRVDVPWMQGSWDVPGKLGHRYTLALTTRYPYQVLTTPDHRLVVKQTAATSSTVRAVMPPAPLRTRLAMRSPREVQRRTPFTVRLALRDVSGSPASAQRVTVSLQDSPTESGQVLARMRTNSNGVAATTLKIRYGGILVANFSGTSRYLPSSKSRFISVYR